MSPRTTIDLQQGALTHSRWEAEQALSDAGVPPEAAAAILRATGRERHIHRIRSVEQHALGQALLDEGLEGLDPRDTPPSIFALAVGLVVLDAFGPVPRFTGEAPRVRHRAFRADGKFGGGGVHALHAAAHGAALLLSTRFGVATPRVVLAPVDGDIHVEISGGRRSASAVLRIWPTERHDCQPCGWTQRVAREGLDRSVGLQPSVKIGAERTEAEKTFGRSPLDLVHAFEGTAAGWGEVWSKASSQQRLETTMDRWARVIADLPADEAQAMPPQVGSDVRRPSMAKALAWVEELEMEAGDREQLAGELAIGILSPSALEERLRSVLGHRLGRTG